MWIVSGLKTSPSNLTVVTVLGLTIFLTSLIPALNRITSLAIFMPPPVEPAIAPQIVKNKSMLFARVGQASVLTLLEIPVVELMLVTWNTASFSAVPKLSYNCLHDTIRLMEITAMDAKIIKAKAINSSLPVTMRQKN